ncbi:MAG: hypothetical protein KIS96_03490 [Bauldia sp.]|nr:hypothetical protein [Bauldia sp.]
MRISVDKNDPGYRSYASAPGVTVFLDGAEVRGCITADEEVGEVVCFRFDSAGRPVLRGEEIATEVRRGSVRIDLPAGWPG